MSALTPAPPLPLSEADARLLDDLYIRGTPPNTLRAYERDLAYIAAWKRAAFDAPLAWPETEAVALRFILDHARDLDGAEDEARRTADKLIAQGLRRGLVTPAPATLDRRISSWRAFHRMRNLTSPFEAPLLRQTRAKARRAVSATRPRPAPKSANPITREVLERLLAACGSDPSDPLRGVRDAAILALGWASGGRRRSEIAALHVEDLDLRELPAGTIRFRLTATKTHAPGRVPSLILKGRAVRLVAAWIEAAELTDGPLFRPISKAGRPLPRPLSPDALRQILLRRLSEAGYPEGFASPHGLRSGFLTQAALDGAPLQAAMRLSLHRSAAQAQRYYDDVEIGENPATELL